MRLEERVRGTGDENNIFSAFGPTNSKGEIDDRAEISHKDYSKMFSSILLAGLTYLTDHPNQYLGIDGWDNARDNARGYMYYRFALRLSKHFGV